MDQMDGKEFLESLQIVELTRNQPELKAVHDFMLKKCIEHAKAIGEKAQKAKEAEEAKTKAEPPKPEPPKPAGTAAPAAPGPASARYTRG